MAQYYIDNNGNDSNAGTTPALPWKTIAKINAAVFQPGDVISFQCGQRFNDAVLTIPSSGTIASPITVTSYGHGLSTISGGTPVTGWTQNGSTGIWSATFNAAAGRPRAIWYDDQRCTRAVITGANIPSSYATTTTGFNTSASTIPGFLNGYANPTDIEFGFGPQPNLNMWPTSRIPVLSVAGNVITMAVQPWANLKTLFTYQGWSTLFTFVENAYEIFASNLKPGTFYHNRTTNTLYVIPPVGANDPRAATIIVPTVETIVSQTGQHDITFTNIKFSHTTCLQPSNAEGFAEVQQGAIVTSTIPPTTLLANFPKLNAAVHINGSARIKFIRSLFENLGSPALTIDGASSACEVAGNLFFDLSSQAMYIGDSAQITVGTAPDSISVHDNVIRYFGVEFAGATAIGSFYASNSTITKNDVAEGPYTGISWGWGWGGTGTVPNANINGSIGSNYVHDVLQSVGDGGGIYINNVQQNLQVTNNLIANLGGNSITANGGLAYIAGIYGDAGNSNWTATGNVIYNRFGQASTTLYNSVFISDWYGAGNVTVSNTTLDAGGVAQNLGAISTSNGNTVQAPSVVGTTAAITAGIALNAGLSAAYSDLLPMASIANTRLKSYLLPLFPTALWPLNEVYGSSSFADVTGNGHTGTITGTGVVAGLFGSLPSDGTTGTASNTTAGMITVPAHADWNFGTGNFTLMACVRMRYQLQAYQTLMANYAGGSNYWQMNIESSNKANMSYTGNGTVGTTPLDDGIWHVYTVTKTGNVIQFYIDGVAETMTGAPNTGGASLGDATKSLGLLGISADGGGPNQASPNTDVKWLGINKGTALTAAQIKSAYAAIQQSGALTPAALNTLASSGTGGGGSINQGVPSTY